MNRRSIVLGGLALTLAPGLASAARRPPAADEGLVYFYHARHKESRKKVSTYIKIDRKLVADLEVGYYTYVYVKAGEHALGVRSGGSLTGIGRTAFPLIVEGGQTQYIRYSRENIESTVIADVTAPPAEEAKQEMAHFLYKAAKKDWDR